MLCVGQVLVDDFSGGGGAVRQTECLFGMSADSLVLVEESTKECIWAVSCKAILGWTSATSSIRLYYHQGRFFRTPTHRMGCVAHCRTSH